MENLPYGSNPAGMRPPGEARLVLAMAAGDRTALARLYDTHAPRLRRLVIRIVGDATHADDVVHDVFVEAWHHARDFDPERGTARAWLTTRARSRALDRVGVLERRGRVTRLLAATPNIASLDFEARVDAAILRRNLLGLPHELAQVIEGAYFRGLSARALARRFEIPIGTVKSRLARAICHLRERLLPLSHHHEGHVTDNLC